MCFLSRQTTVSTWIVRRNTTISNLGNPFTFQSFYGAKIDTKLVPIWCHSFHLGTKNAPTLTYYSEQKSLQIKHLPCQTQLCIKQKYTLQNRRCGFNSYIPCHLKSKAPQGFAVLFVLCINCINPGLADNLTTARFIAVN
jgi:hypothetical protein